ncbi:hypothetical protein E4U43_004052 [Claviceps pusilla]|uniref:Uncharacterized protein n=1 Tax=Claviceps pusilla TaxID=123648 RepID=A0A9P7SWD3_9HYPO|nr:hypothetical protein E4U43_004052 [Claviceps pusilla]
MPLRNCFFVYYKFETLVQEEHYLDLLKSVMHLVENRSSFRVLIRRIEELYRRCERESEWKEALSEQLRVGRRGRSDRYSSDDSDTSRDKEENLVMLRHLEPNTTLRKREDWIDDLRRAIDGGPEVLRDREEHNIVENKRAGDEGDMSLKG